MGLLRQRALAGAVLVAAIPVFPIPGLSGRGLTAGGVARTNTGGALVAASTQPGGLAITRLHPDGSIDLAYGTAGISQPAVGADARATALAINPATGEAWVGVLTRSGASEIVALNGSGERVRSFGSGGVVRLPSPFSGGPRALAWQPGQLLVVAGQRPCSGCEMEVLDPGSGHVTLAQVLDGQGGCATTAITSAVFTDASHALLGSQTLRGPRCDVVLFGVQTKRSRTGAMSLQPVPGSRAVWLAGGRADGGPCLAASLLDGRTAVGRLASLARASGPPTRAVTGAIISATPLGGGACAALIAGAGGRGVVIQTSAGRRSATDTLPRGIRPLGISRCVHHLLVIGARGRQAVVVAVPVREGPYAAAADVATPSAATCPRR